MSSSQKINLIPQARRQWRAARLAGHRWMALSASYGVVAALLWATYGSTGARDYLALASQSMEIQSREKLVKDSVASMQRQLNDAAQRRSVAEELRNRPDWSILLSLLGEEVGDEIMLRELQLAPVAKASRETRPKEVHLLGPDEYKLSIRGIGMSQQAVSQFALRLQRLGLFDEVQMLRSGREPFGGGSGIGFELQCQLAPAEVGK